MKNEAPTSKIMGSLTDKRDKDRRTVLVHAIVRAGQLVEFYTGRALPELREGAMVDLRVPKTDFKDKEHMNALAVQRHVELLPAGTRLFISLNADRMPAVAQKRLSVEHVHPFREPPSLGAYVHMKEPVIMWLNGSKKGFLSAAKCSVPTLGETELGSLNQAYTMLSKEFETGRRSFGGNVFEVAFVDAVNEWHSLEAMRDHVMAEHEREIMSKLGIVDVDARIKEILKR